MASHLVLFCSGVSTSSPPREPLSAFMTMATDSTAINTSENETGNGKTGKIRKTSSSLPEILRETTLEEFLQAVERVREQPLYTEQDVKGNYSVESRLAGQKRSEQSVVGRSGN